MSNYQAAIATLQAAVIGRATSDDAFKKELLANPRAAVETFLNTALPADVQIQVQQAPANTVVLCLPYELAVGAGGELADADLEAVAGGSKAGARSFFEKAGSGIAFGGMALVGGATGTANLLKSTAVNTAKECGL